MDNRDERRDEFLIAMYGELWNNINRHLSVVWESAAVLAGSFAIFALAEKGTLSVDVASALLILVAAWLVAHTYDANAWFNRNLLIVTNIEREFLKPDDERYIHFYFTRHRRPGKMIEHLRVHRDLGLGIVVIILLYHFFTRVMPGLDSSWDAIELERCAPYVASVGALVWVLCLRSVGTKNYKVLLERSPGRPIHGSTSAEIK